VVHAFYDVLLARESVEANDRVVELSDAVLASARDRTARGAAARVDLLQAEADHARTRIPALRAHAELDHRENLLKDLLGWEPDRPLPVRGELRFHPYTVDLQTLVGQAASRRMDLLALEQQVAVKEREFRAAALANTPTVALTGGYEFLQHQRLDFPDEVLSGGVALTWPLFEGFAQIPRVHQARLALEEVRIRRDRLKSRLAVDAEKAYADLRIAEEACRAHENLLTAVAERVQLAETGRGIGARSTPEVASERVALLDARLQGAQLVFEHVIAKAQLDHVVGVPPGEL
jgi:outer membrane protein TolC